MKMTTLKSVAIAVGLCSSAFGQATSPVVGYRTQNIDNGFNLVGINLHNKTLISGVVDSEAGAVVTDADVDFTVSLSDSSATYIFEVLDGVQAGAIAEIVSFTSDTLTLDGVVGAGAASYSIRQAPTLNDTFGDLASAFVAALADTVYVPNGAGGYDTFFKHQGTGNFRSTTAFSDPAKPVSLLYSDAVLIERKSAGPLALVLSGSLKETGTVVNLVEGFNAVSVSGPAGQTLQNSGLDSVLAPAFVAALADTVFVPTGAPGVYDTYFVHQGTGAFRSTTAFTDAPEVSIDNGLLIQRKSGSTAGVFAVPSFYSSL